MGNVLHTTRYNEKLDKVKVYLDTPYKERLPLPVFRKEVGLRKNEFIAMKYEIETHDKEVRMANIRAVQENVMGGNLEEKSVVSKETGQDWLDAHWLEVIQYVFESAKKGNAQSQKLFAQLAGKLVEKQEVTIGLTADEINRRNLEAERQLHEFDVGRDTGYRVEKVQKVVPLLPE